MSEVFFPIPGGCFLSLGTKTIKIKNPGVTGLEKKKKNRKWVIRCYQQTHHPLLYSLLPNLSYRMTEGKQPYSHHLGFKGTTENV